MLIRIELPREVPTERHGLILNELQNQLVKKYPDSAAAIRSAETKVCGADTTKAQITVSGLPGGYGGLDFVLKSLVALLGYKYKGELVEQGTDFSMAFQPHVHA